MGIDECERSGAISLPPPAIRLGQLLESIMTKKDNKTLIFGETKRRVDELTWQLKRDG